MAPDLLSKIHDEINERQRELRPLLAEYEGLLVAVEALLAAGPDGSSAGSATVTPTKRTRRSARVGPTRPVSAAGAIKRAATGKPGATVDVHKKSGKTIKPDARTKTVKPDAGTKTVKPDARTVTREAAVSAGAGGAKEKPARADRGLAREAILAALEHGSHTVGELAVVTAMSGPSINGNLRRLVEEGVVAKTEREGKTAWSLSDIAV